MNVDDAWFHSLPMYNACNVGCRTRINHSTIRHSENGSTGQLNAKKFEEYNAIRARQYTRNTINTSIGGASSYDLSIDLFKETFEQTATEIH